MVDSSQAIASATEFLKDYLEENPDVLIVADATEEKDDCFLVHYNTREWVMDPAPANGLAGNWPVRVDKVTGLTRHTDMEEYTAYCKGVSP